MCLNLNDTFFKLLFAVMPVLLINFYIFLTIAPFPFILLLYFFIFYKKNMGFLGLILSFFIFVQEEICLAL